MTSFILTAWFVAATAQSTAPAGAGETPAAPRRLPASQPRTEPSGFLLRHVACDEITYTYCVYVPPEYDPELTWPVIISLHGSGERGTDGLRQTDIGLGAAIRRNRQRVPAIVIMPQCRPDNVWWSEPMMRMTAACLQDVHENFSLDPARLYVTGFSLGGAGTWFFGARFNKQVAAIAPICGFVELQEPTGLAEKLAPMLATVPCWCFHGANDANVPVERSRELVKLVREAGGNPRYTEFPDGAHAVWDQVYDDPAFWDWLLAQRRRPAASQPAAPPASRPGAAGSPR